MSNDVRRISTLHRWFRILNQIRRGGPVTVDGLAEKFRVTRRTIYRDLEHLQQLQVPLYTDGGRWHLAETYVVPPIAFTLDEVAVLTGALGWAERNPLLGGPAATSAMEKLKDAMTDPSMRALVDELAAAKVVDPLSARPIPGPPGIESVLEQAVRRRQKVELVYDSLYNRETSTRTIHPYGLAYRGVGLYVIGWCELRQSRRTFRLSRIRSVRPLRERFEVPADFDLNAHLMAVWGIEDGPEMEVTLRFSPATAQLARETQWHPTQEVEEAPDGHVLLHMVTRGKGELARWIAQYGGHVTVVEPAELAGAVRAIGEGILQAYQPV